ncbi:hypothetical protein DBT53_004355, partial [Aerococcus mictus]|uniref:hypothetical protein n=1 Tax=Aerococcus mictus TaxID=2976810 RepID=UPI000DCBE23B|nr:hypothetical protein DBT53_12475 [Aerococcus mictus]
MIDFGIWIPALLVYGLFMAWYNNWRGPLTPEEVKAFMAKARAIGSDANNNLETIERFLSEDDGREFIMLNLVRVAPGMVDDPDTGKPTPGRELLNRYTSAFMRRLFMRGGHPALAARKIGGYVDAWHVEPDPGWTIMGYMRYRSRRDMAMLAIDASFQDIHKFKIAGTVETFSFPTRPIITLFIGPRIWVGMAIALVAALANLAVLAF